MEFKIGDTRTVTAKITDETVRKFADVSGDFNPVHMDDEYAKTTRFGKRIAHGMISAAVISRALGMKLGTGGVYLSQELKFVQPVYIDDEITVTLKVLTFHEKRGLARIETNVTNQRNELVVKGEALIMTKAGIESKG